MSIWHCNVGTSNNQKYMLRHNVFAIGLGKTIEDYNYRNTRKGNTTPKQYKKFLNICNNHDIMLLYKNKIGYIAWGYFTGEIYTPIVNKRCPDWPEEIQKNMCVENWNLIVTPFKFDKVIRTTLYKMNENDVMFINDKIDY